MFKWIINSTVLEIGCFENLSNGHESAHHKILKLLFKLEFNAYHYQNVTWSKSFDNMMETSNTSIRNRSNRVRIRLYTTPGIRVGWWHYFVRDVLHTLLVFNRMLQESTKVLSWNTLADSRQNERPLVVLNNTVISAFLLGSERRLGCGSRGPRRAAENSATRWGARYAAIRLNYQDLSKDWRKYELYNNIIEDQSVNYTISKRARLFCLSLVQKCLVQLEPYSFRA